MIHFKRADHIHICVSPERLKEAQLFYTEVLGLIEIYRPAAFSAPGHWFMIGNIELHIGVEAPLPLTIRHSAFEVENIEDARFYLEGKGIHCDFETFIPGRQRFSFLDPFGNRMELMAFDKPVKH